MLTCQVLIYKRRKFLQYFFVVISDEETRKEFNRENETGYGWVQLSLSEKTGILEFFM